MDIFPDLNLNWLLKEDVSMFESTTVLNEPGEVYEKQISNQAIYNKLESIEKKINLVLEKR
jgi:hypothetical protein